METIKSWTADDEAIIATNTDATECKRCAVELGYWKDDYIRYFARHTDRKAPEINRGYYARVKAMEMFINQFLEHKSGRAFVLFLMIDAEPRMQTKPVVFYLFIMWTMIEVVRYPYYISQLYKKEIYILTWLRYTMWIPLYPLGILCEAIVIMRNIPYFEETGRFTIAMPNEWNFTFDMPTFLRVYLLFLSLPGMYLVTTHMHRLRTKKLKPKIIIKKTK